MKLHVLGLYTYLLVLKISWKIENWCWNLKHFAIINWQQSWFFKPSLSFCYLSAKSIFTDRDIVIMGYIASYNTLIVASMENVGLYGMLCCHVNHCTTQFSIIYKSCMTDIKITNWQLLKSDQRYHFKWQANSDFGGIYIC